MSQQLIGILQIVIGIAIIVLVLLQQKGGGMGAVGGMLPQFYGTRRGIEQTMHWITVILGIIFIALAIITFLL